MSISYQAIPNNLRVPFQAVEFDASRAQQGPALLAYRGLILGQMRSAGTATANTAYKLSNADQAIPLFGRGSMLHRQAIAWFDRNRFTEVWAMAVADNGAGVAATGTITFTGTATEAGTMNLLLGAVLVQAAVASGDAFGTVATAVAAAINANTDLPVTASAALGVVTVTHRHKGTVGNDFDMRANYQDGEKTPAGLAVAFAAMSAGATNPVLTSAIAAMGDIWYHIIAHGWTDATSLTALETEMNRRFGPMVQKDGALIASAVGTFGTLGTLGLTRNSKYSVIVSQDGANPVVPPSEYAAGVAAVAAFYGNIDPARPFQTLELGFLPPAEVDRFTTEERNLLLFDGIATTKTGPANAVQIERLITTYRLNAAGASDVAYLDLNTILTLLYLRYSFVNLLRIRYPRHKLADDGTRFGQGQAVITPLLAKGECLGWFTQMEELGLVEGFDQFKRDLVVERNAVDRNRLDFILPPDLMNQFIVAAASIQFRI